jgi:hypothetical protein
MEQTVFRLIEPQADLYMADDQYRAILGCAGEQGGKTSVGIRWLKKEITQKYWDKPYNWLVGAPKYKVLNQATIPTFDKVFTRPWGQFNKQEMAFQMLNEGRPWGKIFFRSSTDPDSGIGIPDCKGALLDEAGKCSRSFFYMALGRVARLGGRIFMATTPYALNWIKKDIIDPYERLEQGKSFESQEKEKLARQIIYRRWASFQNPTYPKEEADRLKAILPQRVYNMRVLGVHDKAEGLIHDGWGEYNYIDKLPGGPVTYVGAVDWGFDHPFAAIVIGCYNDGCVIESIVKQRHLGPQKQKDLIKAKHTQFKPKMWFGGHDQPGMIHELNTEGIPIVKYFEYSPQFREVISGDQKATELINAKRLRVLNGIAQVEDFEDEIETYRWDRDEDDDMEGREKPIDTNNDLMATLRYASIGAYSLGLLKQEKIVVLDSRRKVDRDLFKPTRKQSIWTDY